MKRIRNIYFIAVTLMISLLATGCYSFKDVSIPPEVKTVRVNYIENRAPYVNPQLSPQLTERLRQKINNQTRLTLIQGDNADYEINAVIRGYNVTTAAYLGAAGGHQQARGHCAY